MCVTVVAAEPWFVTIRAIWPAGDSLDAPPNIFAWSISVSFNFTPESNQFLKLSSRALVDTIAA